MIKNIRISFEKLKLLYLKVALNLPEHENYHRRYKKNYRKVCAAAKKIENDQSYLLLLCF